MGGAQGTLRRGDQRSGQGHFADAPGDKPTIPFLLIHGDADKVVPLSQSKKLVEAITKAGGSAELIVKAGGGHPWLTLHQEVKVMADWFDKQLGGKTSAGSAA